MPKLLIIDDEIEICEVLRSFFSSKNFEVFVVNESKNAFKVFEDKEPHIVLLDIGMPEVSGFEVLKRLKEKSPQIKVIMITAMGDEETEDFVRNIGADGLIIKPFSLKEIERYVNQVLNN